MIGNKNKQAVGDYEGFEPDIPTSIVGMPWTMSLSVGKGGAERRERVSFNVCHLSSKENREGDAAQESRALEWIGYSFELM